VTTNATAQIRTVLITSHTDLAKALILLVIEIAQILKVKMEKIAVIVVTKTGIFSLISLK
jgi:hypothetical protein